MKRVLLWSLAGLMALVLGLTSIVLLRADSVGLPAPDPAQPIHLGDGTTRPLSEVLQLAKDGELPPPAQPMKISFEPPNANLPEEERAAQEQELRELTARIERTIRMEENSLFGLAEVARLEGRLDEAQALYLSIPEDDPRYARARRRLAWNVLTKGRGQPGRAVMFAKQSVVADPLNGNGWHDLARVCGATLGIDMD